MADQNLQSVLDTGNVAIKDMTLTGDLRVVGNIYPTTISALGSQGSVGQILSSTATGILWINSPSISCCSLDDVLAVGNTTTKDITINSGDFTVQGSSGSINVLGPATFLSTGIATFNNTVDLTGALTFSTFATLVDGTGAVGAAGNVLTSTGSGVAWSSSAGTCCTIQDVLSAGSTATDQGLTFAGTSVVTLGANNNIISAGVNTWSATNTFTATGNISTTAGVALTGSLFDGTSTGSAGQILTSTSTGVSWATASVGTQGLQSVLDIGNSATGTNANITISGTLDAGTITDNSGSIGASGQFLSATGTGLAWSSSATTCCNLDDTLAVGATSTRNMTLTDDPATPGVSTYFTVPLIIPTLIQDSNSSTGTINQVLSSTGTGLDWVDVGSVNSVDETAPGTSTGTPIVVDPTTGAVLVQSMAYAGTSNIGHVPTGGGATTFLRGDGTWVTPTGTGSMNDFDITDGATTQTITNGDTITFTVGTPVFSAGTGLTATVSATDTLTLVNTGITGLTVGANLGITIAADGQAALTYTGGSMASWTLGDNTSTVSIPDGTTVNMIGGTGITSSLSGTDITLSNDGLVSISSANTAIGVGTVAGAVTVTSTSYGGGTTIGHVPTGSGSDATKYLDGSGAWTVPAATGTGVTSFTNTNGTFVSAGTANAAATGVVTTGIIDLSATGTPSVTTFLRGDNTWIAPGYTRVALAATAVSTGDPLKLVYDAATNLYDINAMFFDGGANIGVVPSASAAVAGSYLDKDGGWTVPAGAGSGVTSVTTTDGTFINLTPNTATTGAVTVTAELSATGLGTPTSDFYLRGDNTWATLGSGLVTSLTIGAAGTSTGLSDSMSVNSTVGAITLTPNKYAGASNIGIVPEGGSASTFLRGDGTWVTPSGGTMSNFIVSDNISTQTVTTGQTVNIVSGGTPGITVVLGTSPTDHTFTVTNSGVTGIVAGNGITVSGATGNVTVTNDAPQIVERTFYSNYLAKGAGSSYFLYNYLLSPPNDAAGNMVHSPDWLSPNVSDPSALAGNAGTDVEQQNSFLLSNAPTPYNSYTKVLKGASVRFATDLGTTGASADCKVILYKIDNACEPSTVAWKSISSAVATSYDITVMQCIDFDLSGATAADLVLEANEAWALAILTSDSGTRSIQGNIRLEVITV